MEPKTIKGEEIREHLPDSVLDDLKLAFQDLELDFEKDLQHCDMHISSKGTCWIHDTRNKEWNWNGTLIATFTVDGSSFYFTKKTDRNSQLLHDYTLKRTEFFKVPRKAHEVDEFEKKFRF